MLIVLEGADGVGKSTIARRLAQLLDADIIHCTRETPNDFEFFSEIIEAAKTRNIIADRFCYGQFVYQAPEERHLYEEQLHKLELRMLLTGAKLVLVTCSPRLMQQRLDERAEKIPMPAEELLSRFREVTAGSILPVTVWRT